MTTQSVVGAGRSGERDPEHRAAGNTLDRDRSAVRLGDRVHDGEAEAGAAGGARARHVAAHETFEQGRLQVCGDAGSVIRHDQLDAVAGAAQARDDGRAGRSVDTRVGEQVDDDLAELAAIRVEHHRVFGHLHAPDVVGAGMVGIHHGFGHHGGQVDVTHVGFRFGVESREQQQVLDE